MAQTDQPERRPDAFLTADLLLDLHGQTEAGGVLGTAVHAGARLGVPFGLAFLPYDPGVRAWHLTALLAPDGSPAPLDQLEVSLGPLTLDPPALADDDRLLSLTDLFGSAWGADNCRRLAKEYGVHGVLLRSVGLQPGATSKVVALLNDPATTPVVSRLLAHAALALTRTGADVAEAPDRVLAPDALLRQLQHEVARAARYERPLAVVYAELRSQDEAARAGPLIGHRLRRWDSIGRLDTDAPVLLTVLPETSGREAALFVRRSAGRFGTARPGIAATPEDGNTVERLLEVARSRSVADRGEDAAPAGEVWIREGSTAIAWQGRMPDQARCPVCAALYLHPRRTGATAAELEDQRVAARATLAALCPEHGEQVMV